MPVRSRADARRRRFRAHRLAPALFVLLVAASPALADCSDPPAPGVEWRRCYLDGREFVGADLTDAILRDTSLQRADLRDSKLIKADAHRAKFNSADLRGTRLDRADLGEADFTRANLAGASLRGADLRRARFFRADLRGVDFTGARMAGADLLNADLSGATWVDGQNVCAEGSLGQCQQQIQPRS